jgi:pyrimidine operon attenuation protein/uracil phosphoribosyltransferase
VAEGRADLLMDRAAIDRALNRITHEILERNIDPGELALVGIRSRGVPLAERLRQRIAAVERRVVPFGILDITLYRDDLTSIGPHAVLKETRIAFPIDGRRIVLVDDVLYTGRTIRAALDGLVDFGRPRSIQLAVLIDRGLRELPIHADYVGRTVATRPEQMVAVRLLEIDGRDEVVLEKRAPQGGARPHKPRVAAARPAARGGARRSARPAR